MSGIVGGSNNRGSGLIADLGTDGQVMTSAGLGQRQVYEAVAAGGKILQVIYDESCYQGHITNSTSYIDVHNTSSATWEVAITPSATTSKILVRLTVHVGWGWATGSEVYKYGYLKVMQKIGSGSYTTVEDSEYLGINHSSGAVVINTLKTYVVLENLMSPGTTSEIKYKVQFKAVSGNWNVNHNPSNSSFTLMEVDGS